MLTLTLTPTLYLGSEQLPHNPVATIPRGGGTTGDHVDILGRQTLNELILRVAAGSGDSIRNSIVSPIAEYAAKVKIYEEPGEAAPPPKLQT